MYYIGLDIHKKTISYCVKDQSEQICVEGVIPATRADLDRWMSGLPQPWTAAMEATMFTGWIRPSGAARASEGGQSANVKSDRSSQEEKRSNRCRQAGGLLAVRFSSGVLHGLE
jgi:hypothetical protein